jgi:hypothetical protein
MKILKQSQNTFLQPFGNFFSKIERKMIISIGMAKSDLTRQMSLS